MAKGTTNWNHSNRMPIPTISFIYNHSVVELWVDKGQLVSNVTKQKAEPVAAPPSLVVVGSRVGGVEPNSPTLVVGRSFHEDRVPRAKELDQHVAVKLKFGQAALVHDGPTHLVPLVLVEPPNALAPRLYDSWIRQGKNLSGSLVVVKVLGLVVHVVVLGAAPLLTVNDQGRAGKKVAKARSARKELGVALVVKGIFQTLMQLTELLAVHDTCSSSHNENLVRVSSFYATNSGIACAI